MNVLDMINWIKLLIELQRTCQEAVRLIQYPYPHQIKTRKSLNVQPEDPKTKRRPMKKEHK